ncbi:MAG TPA: cell division protein FtsA, partial [Roseococcus sp.]|nr:cell division protein FtsA [Roseococcus sp.]
MNQLVRAPASEPPARQRRLGTARPGVFGVLDIGSTKIVCLIARIEGDGTPRALGFGWQRARGVKGACVVDLEEAERAIRTA